MSSRETAQSQFAKRIAVGEFDKEIETVLMAWQVENAEKRIKDYIDNLQAKYDGERLSVSGLNQQHIDELLHLGRELHQETRKAYLKANLEQYLHDLQYIKEPSIYITGVEWGAIRNGEANHLEVYRNWVSSKIDEIEAELNEEAEAPLPTSIEEMNSPKRGRKAKVD